MARGVATLEMVCALIPTAPRARRLESLSERYRVRIANWRRRRWATTGVARESAPRVGCGVVLGARGAVTQAWWAHECEHAVGQ
jgi:hypothetical protein